MPASAGNAIGATRCAIVEFLDTLRGLRLPLDACTTSRLCDNP